MPASPGSLLLSLVITLWLLPLFVTAVGSASSESARKAVFYDCDVVIYGNTVAALAAAIQTTRMNKTVAIVFPGTTLGGLTTSGLGWTDSKDGNTIGGIAREFYGRVFDYYQGPDAWERETRSDYLDKNIGAQPGPAIDEQKQVQWTFEPKAAEAIWEKWITDEKIPVFRNEAIDRSSTGVSKQGTLIKSFRTESGSVFAAKMFIDASYEGDFMETAGVPYRVGRESREEYDESAAGIYINGKSKLSEIDPYIEPRNSSSGLIAGIQRDISDRESIQGDADPKRLQSYNYRLCLTTVEDNKASFSKPEGYNESSYEILFRYIESGYDGEFFTSQLMPNIKTDTNANGQVSTDLIGGNYDARSNYAEYSYRQREVTAHAHKTWAQGLLWTLANHERVPEDIRTHVGAWGYAKDEWVSNDNWPYEVYIREGRRMNGMYTMTQEDIQEPKTHDKDSVIGVGFYTLDVHQVERVVFEGIIYDEGLVHVPNDGGFTIPFSAIVPQARYATNFLNPVTMSSTHVALSALRMEPTYMILGQSSATAAVMALEQGVNIQDVDREKLTARLKEDNQVLESSARSLESSYRGLVVVFLCIFMIVYFMIT
ncbi:hypothetical protein FZEAL_8969 [Fusarium zealandicum]|uniref:Xanthan lyase n=1 Tax=Fusarium zealandicum TaxID=1053134 RepID=A0A8H4XGB1_9HYPO|nr:hypothetical protein FZEAL_8969 [Fusarium zealandicum]